MLPIIATIAGGGLGGDDLDDLVDGRFVDDLRGDALERAALGRPLGFLTHADEVIE
jgi:hypothetical protein